MREYVEITGIMPVRYVRGVSCTLSEYQHLKNQIYQRYREKLSDTHLMSCTRNAIEHKILLLLPIVYLFS